MSVTPKASWPWVRTLLRSVYDQPDADSVVARYDRVLNSLAEKLPKVAEHLERTALTSWRSPRSPWRSGASSGPTTLRKFASNGAWLVLAAMAFNLTRAAGTIASVFHAKAGTATIRRQLIAVPGHLARAARRMVIHLPKDWPGQDSWEGLFNGACGPPTPETT